MTLEPFAQGASPLHQLDPRVKLVAAFAYAAVAAVSGDFLTLGTALLFSLAMAAWALLSPGLLLRRLLLVNTFIVMLWCFLPFTYPGERVFTLGPLTASREGLRLALLLTLRANAIVLATIALVGTTPAFGLAHAMQHLHLPQKLVQLFFFTYRYIHLIGSEYTRLRAAMRIRCFRPRTSLHTYASYAYLVGMLLVRSYERSQRVYQAMCCRGFKGQFPVYRHFRLTRRDLIQLGVIGAFIIILVVL